MNVFTKSIGGRTLTIEIGTYAQQANGACTVRYGDTVVLATAVISSTVREGIDYFPLLVDYEERLYAAGKIKGSRFIKREGRPSDEAILTARLVDRSIRPLFDQAQRKDVQVVSTVFSVDQENDPDIPSLIAASCAVHLSDIPWAGPVAGVRVGRIGGEWVLNPTYEAREKSELDLVVVGTREKIVMIEAGAQEIAEDVVLDALAFGQKHLRSILDLIEEARRELGLQKIDPGSPSDEERAARDLLEQKVRKLAADRIAAAWQLPKDEREKAIMELVTSVDETLKSDNAVSKDLRLKAPTIVQKLLDAAARELVLRDGKRVDGRALDEIRPLSCAVGVLPRTHGSGLFNRGETQALSIVTLGSPGDEQVLDTMEESGKKRYMHHYNFPGFSVGEVAPVRGPGRREIGHGALAEKALLPVLPSKEDFPYTMRVVSEVLSSNGSTSQAAVCGSSLALMDAGVPITRPVAGIAMGLVTDEAAGTFKILTDIQGIEDHAYDMDFKVSGTATGITAIQVDVKNAGIPLEVCKEAFAGAKRARATILDVITKVIAAPRPELSPYAPRITVIRIDPEKIREVIGRGGETINKIIDECGGRDVTKIDIEDDGLVMVTSHHADMAKKAMTWIEQLTHDIVVGEVYEGTVSQIVKDRLSGKEIGAIVDIVPGKDGMVHISQLSPQHVENVSAVVKVGDKLRVKVVEVDTERGRIGLSVRALTEEYVPRDRGFRNHRGPDRRFRR